MPRRAPAPCNYTGCPGLAVAQGRCEDHPHPHRWGQRPDERERYGLTSHQYKQLKQRITRRDRGRCYRCGQPGHAMDHIWPIAEGGAKTDPANLGIICDDCHTEKTAAEIARSNRRRSRQQTVRRA